jgi:hypothetical protein
VSGLLPEKQEWNNKCRAPDGVKGSGATTRGVLQQDIHIQRQLTCLVNEPPTKHPLPVTRIDSDPKNGPGTRDVPTVIRTTGRIRNCDDARMLHLVLLKTTGVDGLGKQEWARSIDNIPYYKGASPVVPVTETTVPGLCHPNITIAG